MPTRSRQAGVLVDTSVAAALVVDDDEHQDAVLDTLGDRRSAWPVTRHSRLLALYGCLAGTTHRGSGVTSDRR